MWKFSLGSYRDKIYLKKSISPIIFIKQLKSCIKNNKTAAKLRCGNQSITLKLFNDTRG